MNVHPRWATSQKLRRIIIWVWISITIGIAAYVALTTPFNAYFGEDNVILAIVAPPTTIVLLGLGFAWLVVHVLAARTQDAQREKELSSC